MLENLAVELSVPDLWEAPKRLGAPSPIGGISNPR